MNVSCNYCWWKKSCTSWYGKYPIIYKVLYMPGGAGFSSINSITNVLRVQLFGHFLLPGSSLSSWNFWMGRQHDLSLLHRGGSIVKRGNPPPQKKHTEKQTSGGTHSEKCQKTMWCVCHPVFEFFQILVEEELWRANARLKVHVLTKIGMRCVSPLLAFYKGVSPATWLNATTKNRSWLAWHEVLFAWLEKDI